MHVDDPAQVVEARELHGDPALGPAEVDLDPGLQPVREPIGELGQARRGRLGPGDPAHLRRPGVADRDDLLEAADADALGDHAGGQPVLELGVLDGEQRAGVAGRQDAGGDLALDRRPELEQPDRVADLGPGAADPRGQLLVGAAEVLEELLVGRGLLERVQLRAVQVLQQRVAQHGGVVGVADDRGDGGQPGLLRGPQPALPHHQLVAVRTGAPHHDGLEQPDLADRVHQLGHRLLVEDLAGLGGVRPDRVDRQLGEGRALDGRQLRTALRRLRPPAGARRWAPRRPARWSG